MKLGVSLPDDLVAFADEVARRRRTTRSGYLAQLLETERMREQVGRYIDRHGWDVAEDDEAWRRHQRHRMQEDYGDDCFREGRGTGPPSALHSGSAPEAYPPKALCAEGSRD
jgi:hypothetical protein